MQSDAREEGGLHQFVSQRLEERIEFRERNAKADFFRLQLMSWAAITFSFLSSIMIASPYLSSLSIIPAVFAAVPGFLIAAESGMNFAKRTRMNEDAYLTYEHLLFRLRNGEDPRVIFDEYIEYSKRLAEDFPVGAVLPTISSSPKPPTRPSEAQVESEAETEKRET